MLKHLFSISLLFVSLTALSPAAQAWTEKDSLWEAAYLATHIADWGQTRSIANSCAKGGQYYETNPILGKCPSVQMVNTYFVSTALLHVGVAQMLPSKYRRWFQTGTLALQLNVISSNKNIGLKISF